MHTRKPCIFPISDSVFQYALPISLACLPCNHPWLLLKRTGQKLREAVLIYKHFYKTMAIYMQNTQSISPCIRCYLNLQATFFRRCQAQAGLATSRAEMCSQLMLGSRTSKSWLQAIGSKVHREASEASLKVLPAVLPVFSPSLAVCTSPLTNGTHPDNASKAQSPNHILLALE